MWKKDNTLSIRAEASFSLLPAAGGAAMPEVREKPHRKGESIASRWMPRYLEGIPDAAPITETTAESGALHAGAPSCRSRWAASFQISRVTEYLPCS